MLVGVETAPGQSRLRSVPEEIRRVREHVRPVTVLQDEAATRDNVLTAMTSHRWAHLACHGRQDPAQPANSSVALADGPLSILEIAMRTPEDCELAFLSACQTFTGTLPLADEAIHLASAFQMAGYRHVIATRWAINDYLAPDVAERVYRVLARDGVPRPARAAEALHQAVAWLRELTPGHPHLWAPYVHIGP